MRGARGGRWGLSTLLLLGSWLVASVALADALVVVNVRDAAGQPAEGKVILQAEVGGASFTCQTQQGSCQIPNVPGGSYKASVVPTGSNQATPARTVMIPPGGKVSLIVSTASSH